ncbi:MAG TPA: glycosyltransferase [Ktedonobacteraceae bacterium]|nr:glycosyltransferase [Ktedonobacteraceae bacterium]
MNQQHKPIPWLRLLLWSHVLSIIAFYLILWFRTNPRTEKPSQKPSPTSPANPVGTDLSRPPRANIARPRPSQKPSPTSPANPVGTDLSRPPHANIVRPRRANIARPRRANIVRPRPSSEPSHPPTETIQKVSIIVPARNEQRNIQRCVTSLLEQDYASYEVIVVDDGSTDDTPCILDDIARHHPHGDKLWVLRLKDLPPDWAGKPHALHAGVQEAHGNWLLFTDADTWHAPTALRTALARATCEGIDLFSLGTKQQLPGFWNKVMMPIAYLGISMQYPTAKVNDPTSAIAIANGQFILISRAVYDIIGGYARPDLRNTLLDDRDLAYIVKQNGFRLRVEDGRDLVHVYMYSNLRDTWRGWRKNAYLGSRGGLPFVLLEITGLPMIGIVPFLLPFLAWLSWRTSRTGRDRFIKSAFPGGTIHPRIVPLSPRELTLAGALELSSALAYRLWLDRKLDVPWYYAFTYPLAAALFTGILAESAWRVLTHKGIDWRGRTYYGK